MQSNDTGTCIELLTDECDCCYRQQFTCMDLLIPLHRNLNNNLKKYTEHIVFIFENANLKKL